MEYFMMKKVNLVNLFAVLGILFCSLNVQAMEQEEVKPARPVKVPNWLQEDCLFNHWALGQIIGNTIPQENWPQDLTHFIGNMSAALAKSTFSYLKIEDVNNFYCKCCAIDYMNSFRLNNEYIVDYKKRVYTIDDKAREEFVPFYYRNLSEANREPVPQLLELVDIDGDKLTYKFTIMPEKGNTIQFSINIVSKSYLNTKVSYANSCFDNLNKTYIGKNPIDLYLSTTEFYKKHPAPDWMEWAWTTLRQAEYDVYDRRVEYETASEERKREMEEEAQSAHGKNSGGASVMQTLGNFVSSLW